MPQGDKLTTKQLKFVECYAGNATEAARLAGYKGNDVTLQSVGKENLRKPLIVQAIKARQDKSIRPLIATREERQAFWTEVMKGPYKMADRLRAAELLGKSEADFTEKVQVSGQDGGPQVILHLFKNGSEAPTDDGSGSPSN